MKTRKIGSLEVSVIGLGANNFGGCLDESLVPGVISAALEAGVNLIDTADVYANTMSEQCIGKALRNRRDDVVLATKFGMAFDDDHTGGAKPDYVRTAVEGSLQRLETDRIDLYILHRPDPKTPIAETLEALDGLVRAGKVREIGCSAFSLEQLIEADMAAKSGAARFVNLQSQFSLLHRAPESGILQECGKRGIGFVPYSPLANGLLTGKYRRNEQPPEGSRIAKMADERKAAVFSERNLEIVEALGEFATQHGRTLLELAICWLLAHDEVSSVIAGAMSPTQIQENATSASWKLTTEELAEIDKLSRVA